jgi:hypothetical protein
MDRQAERDAIQAAIARLLAGTPTRSTGALTVLQLAAEAGVKRWVLTHKHPDLRQAFEEQRQAANGLPGPGWAPARLLHVHVHDGIRGGIALLRRVNAAVCDGDDQRAKAELRRLAARNPNWTLHTFCVAFCNFVRGHHDTEDFVVFPLLLQHAGGQVDGLAQVINTLTADHRVLAGHLDRAQEAVAALPGDAATRSCAVHAVDDLASHLATHLDDEERRLAPALNALSGVVPGHTAPPPTARYLHGYSPG